MINLMTPINDLGYGVAGLNILKALQKHTEVALHVIGQPQATRKEDIDAVKKGLETAKSFDHNAPCVKIWHQNQMAERIGSGKFIGFPIFELDTFTDLEKHHLRSCDELMVCSQWAKDVVLSNIFPADIPVVHDLFAEKIHVVPLGVDTDIFEPAPEKQNDKIIFFNCGKWEVRKGHDILIKAFTKVAEKHENVELWMMCSNPFNSEQEENNWHQLYNHPKVKIIPRAETQQGVYNIMSQVDCGVFPSRAEGWNLELLEMMACGKHVIATDYSAHTEFCTQENCNLIPIHNVEPAFDGKWFFNQGNWAKVNVEDLQSVMESFVDSYKGKVNQAGLDTTSKFNWNHSSEKILQCLKMNKNKT